MLVASSYSISSLNRLYLRWVLRNPTGIGSLESLWLLRFGFVDGVLEWSQASSSLGQRLQGFQVNLRRPKRAEHCDAYLVFWVDQPSCRSTTSQSIYLQPQ